jgi:predicted DNA-binding protein (MmcQ/YjbR family)
VSPRTPKASPPANHLERIRALTLGFPEATEVLAWGHPTFRVRDKIFATTGFDGTTLGVKCTPEQQADLVSSDPRFSVAAYVGKHGWVTMSLAGKVDFGFVESLIAESYRLVAPKTLSGSGASSPKKAASKKTSTKKTSAKKTAVKKTSSTTPRKSQPRAAAKKTAPRKKG